MKSWIFYSSGAESWLVQGSKWHHMFPSPAHFKPGEKHKNKSSVKKCNLGRKRCVHELQDSTASLIQRHENISVRVFNMTWHCRWTADLIRFYKRSSDVFFLCIFRHHSYMFPELYFWWWTSGAEQIEIQQGCSLC